MSQSDPLTISLFETPERLKHLPMYDYSTLTAINTCPTWGVLRYGMGKAMPGAGRAMALEAGQVCHDVFAAIRFLQLLRHQTAAADHANHHGPLQFGTARWEAMCEVLKQNNTDTTNATNFVLECLHTSGYVDNPDDRRRTMSNIETTCLQYLSRWDWTRYPIWLEDKNDPTKRIGIEVPIDVCIVYPAPYAVVGPPERIVRYVGRMDGLHHNGDTDDAPLILHENKSSGRLDEAWRMSFLMSHQVTGYCSAASVIAQRPVHDAIVLGAQLPLPKNYGDGIAYELARREQYHTVRWLKWVLHSVEQYEAYHNDPIDAPKYTHSCSRYFRPCPFVPFCYEDRDGMQQVISQMVDDRWNPLDHDPNKSGE